MAGTASNRPRGARRAAPKSGTCSGATGFCTTPLDFRSAAYCGAVLSPSHHEDRGRALPLLAVVFALRAPAGSVLR